MALSVLSPRADAGLQFDVARLDSIIRNLAERYEFRLEMGRGTGRGSGRGAAPALAGGLALLGGLLGLWLGGRWWGLAGAVTGAGAAVVISFNQAWDQIKDQLTELYYIVYNFLRSLNITDYMQVGHVIYQMAVNRERLAKTMLEFLSMQMGGIILSNLQVNSA